MLKSELLSVLQEEIRRHDFSYFIDEPPGVARGGRGVCVPGCSSWSNMASATGSASTASRDFAQRLCCTALQSFAWVSPKSHAHLSPACWIPPNARP